MQCFEEYAFGEGPFNRSVFERQRGSTAEKFEKLLLKLRKKDVDEIVMTSHDMFLNHVQIILKYKEVIYVIRNLRIICLYFQRGKLKPLKVCSKVRNKITKM